MSRIVNLDGALLRPEEATISVYDRGFLYGDSVYEVVRTYGGVPFELAAHLARLAHSAERIALSFPWPLGRIAAEIERTIAAAGNAESYARVIVTRGSGALGLDPGLARDGRVIILVQPLVTPPPEAYARGIAAAIVGVRRTPADSLDPSAKTGNYLNNILALEQARALGASDALMLDHQGRVTEATTANVFAVRDGVLLTPPLQVGILEGVTRRIVLELARAAGVPTGEAWLTAGDLLDAEEIFITSTTRELVPVTRLHYDGPEPRPVGGGEPGPITRRLLADFRARAAQASARQEP